MHRSTDQSTYYHRPTLTNCSGTKYFYEVFFALNIKQALKQCFCFFVGKVGNAGLLLTKVESRSSVTVIILWLAFPRQPTSNCGPMVKEL